VTVRSIYGKAARNKTPTMCADCWEDQGRTPRMCVLTYKGVDLIRSAL
jgi:hypothetical protein